MKVIFLDIDGVLVTNRSCNIAGAAVNPPFDELAVLNLNTLISTSKAGIVISSSWRTDRSLNMKDELRRAEVKCDIVGQTPVLGGRGLEIAVWLLRHAAGIEQFVILDDMRDDILCSMLAENLVSTSFSSGFDKLALCRALAILRGKKVSTVNMEPIGQFAGFGEGRP